MKNEVEQIDLSIFQKVDIRVGVIVSLKPATECRIPAYELEINFGSELGNKFSIAQLTNYPKEKLIGRQVLALVNLKPKKIGKYISEVLTLGVPTKDQGTSLVVPDLESLLGGKLF